MIATFLRACTAVLTFGNRGRRRRTTVHRLSPTPAASKMVDLATVARTQIRYYPGRPVGYAGFTDHHAMNCTLNDDLIGRTPAEQFQLVGFGVGLLGALMARLNGREEIGAILQLPSASAIQARYIGWLSLMQDRGTDNATPSSANLLSGLNGLWSTMLQNGPVTTPYWDDARDGAVHSGTEESASRAWKPLLHLFERSREEGQKLTHEATIEEIDL